MSNRKLAACGAAMLLLAACGGGGGGSPTSQTTPDSIGEQPTSPGSSAQSHTFTARELEAFVQDAAEGRFGVAPTIHPIAGQWRSAQDRAVVALAVEGLNGSLPLDHHIRIGRELSPGEARAWASGAAPPNTVVLQHDVYANWLKRCETECPYGQPIGLWKPVDDGRYWRNRSWAAIDRNVTDRQRKHALVVHELMHALGFVDHSERSDSITHQTAPWRDAAQRGDMMFPIDRAAVLAHRKGSPHVNYGSFGPWELDLTRETGRAGLIDFGVEAGNGHVRPWIHHAYGPQRVSDGTVGTGTATWAGTALGMTADRQVVRGESALTLDLNTRRGSLSLTGLSWSRGDLRYDVRLTPYGLENTTGSPDRVYGHLYDDDRTAAGTVHQLDAGFAWAGRR